MLTTSTQEIVFGLANQALILDCEDGRPSAVVSVEVFSAHADDTTTAEAATTGSAAVEATPNTTLSAAAGPGNAADPTALMLTSGTSVAIGRRYLLTEDGTGMSEQVEVAAVAGTSVTLRHPLRNDYSTGSTFVSTRCSIGMDSGWVADQSNLSPLYTPNPGYRVRWVVTLGGEPRVYERGLDLVRYPSRHGVTALDVDRIHPGWLDRLPPDYQADQGRALIGRAFDGVKFELYGDGLADQALRNPELVARLVIERAWFESLQEAAVLGGGSEAGLREAERRWRQIYDQTLRAPVAPVDRSGGGASVPVIPRPLTVR